MTIPRYYWPIDAPIGQWVIARWIDSPSSLLPSFKDVHNDWWRVSTYWLHTTGHTPTVERAEGPPVEWRAI